MDGGGRENWNQFKGLRTFAYPTNIFGQNVSILYIIWKEWNIDLNKN